MNKLEEHLTKIEGKLGGSSVVPAGVTDKLDWHLTNIESLIGGGSGGDSYTKEETDALLEEKQEKLISAINIKTINSQSLLGEGNIYIQGGGGAITWNDIENKPNFATVATSGSYNDLSNKPTIPTVPTNVSAFTNDAGYLSSVTWGDVTGKPTFATVATSGSYEDLTNKPTIPTVPTNVSAFTNDAGYVTDSYHDSTKQDVINDLEDIRNGAADGATAVQPLDVPGYQANTVIVIDATHNISGKNLTTYTAVETTIGGYDVIQIKKSGEILDVSSAESYMAAQTGSTFLPIFDYDNPTFTYFIFANGKIYKPQYDSTNGLLLYYMNQLAYHSEIPTVPTNVSDFTNDAGYITGIDSNDVTTALGFTPGTSNFSGSYTDLTDKPTIPEVPTNVSSFTNDAGYAVESDLGNAVFTPLEGVTVNMQHSYKIGSIVFVHLNINVGGLGISATGINKVGTLSKHAAHEHLFTFASKNSASGTATDCAILTTTGELKARFTTTTAGNGYNHDLCFFFCETE